MKFTGFFDALLQFSNTAVNWIWGPPLLALLLGAGLYLSYMTRGLQFRQLGKSLKLLFSREVHQGKGEGDISPWAALMTALSATVGNGNLAGLATAIALGGPGAPVFMWIAGIIGMATKYAEGVLGVHFREKAPNGTMAGGPMYYLKQIKNQKLGAFLSKAFAVLGVIAGLIGAGNMAQSNSMTESLANTVFQHVQGSDVQTVVPPLAYYLVIGLIISLLVGFVIIRGIKTIGKVTEKLVPAMILFYFFFAFWIIIANIEFIPAAFELIFSSAFGLQPILGATVGIAIQRGISLGSLSNEAGLGSAAIAQAASNSDDPRKNGLIAMTGVFIDTILANTLTTLTIVLTGAYLHTQAWAGSGIENPLTGIVLTQHAFTTVIPSIGGEVIAIASFVFGLTTLIGWAYYGEKCIEFLGGNRVILPYRYVFILFLFLGAIITPLAGESYAYMNIIWNVGSIANGLMAIPNLIGLFLLAKVVVRLSGEDLGK